MNSAEPPDPGRPEPETTSQEGLHRKIVRALFSLLPWRLVKRLNRIEAQLTEDRQRITDFYQTHEPRIGRVETRLDGVEAHLRGLQAELEALRDQRTLTIEKRLDGSEQRLDGIDRHLGKQDGEIGRVRDTVVPAAAGRVDALVDRLARDLEEIASLVERVAAREPLPTPRSGQLDAGALETALSSVHADLIRGFRGPENEIKHRLGRYMELLEENTPVLDLGCGRGELLSLLREAGVESRGVENDPAMVKAARRRGLDVVEGDLLTMLQREPDGSWAAVTAIHVFEHLPQKDQVNVLAELRRVLSPGGLLIVESPNPNTLVVGASEYWLDPTHLRPVPPETLRLFIVAAGFEVEELGFLHPFPDDQKLGALMNIEGETESSEDDCRLHAIVTRLDELLFGPRDFLIVARRPNGQDPSDGGVLQKT